jgi:hypothetical protein
MPLAQVSYESGATLSHVYFPTTAIVSLLYVLENGAAATAAMSRLAGIAASSGYRCLWEANPPPVARSSKVPAKVSASRQRLWKKSLIGPVRCCTYCCAIPKPSSLRCRKPLCATAIILWINSYADGCC